MNGLTQWYGIKSNKEVHNDFGASNIAGVIKAKKTKLARSRSKMWHDRKRSYGMETIRKNVLR